MAKYTLSVINMLMTPVCSEHVKHFFSFFLFLAVYRTHRKYSRFLYSVATLGYIANDLLRTLMINNLN